MAIEVNVPDIGDFKDVPIISILVNVGDSIAVEDALIELESDKATMEVPSPVAGRIAAISVNVGDRVSEGALILTVEAEGVTAADAPAQDAPKQNIPDRPAPAAGSALAAAPVAAAPAGGAITDSGFGKAHASPSVRAFARQLGVDLGRINGSGRKGRILREDVAAALKASAAPVAAAPAQGGMGIPPIPVVDFSKFGPVEDVEMPRIKKLSGPALHRSWLNVPHVTHNEDADITEIDRYRKELDDEAKKDGYRVTLLSFVIKASVSALRKHWEFNSSIHPDGDKLIRKSYYNIGFAADTPNGLVVPVIKDADKKGVLAISEEMGALAKKARDGKLGPADMSGATFTISSLGGIGGRYFTPIINAPEVAILGVCRSNIEPVWDGKAFQPRLMLPLSLTWDHRVIDGAAAACFNAYLGQILGDFRRVLL